MKEEEIYQKAKKEIFEDSLNFARCLKTVIGLGSEKYEMGFIASYYTLQNHDAAIDSMIECFSKEYQEQISSNQYIKEDERFPDIITQEYTEILAEVGLSIVEKHPLKALKVFHLINDTYERAGVLPQEILELSVEIVCRIADDDIEKALELVDIIDVDYYKIDTLKRIIGKTDDTLLLNRMKVIMSTIKDRLEE